MFDGQLNHGGHKVTVPDKLAEELKRAGHTLPPSVAPDLEPPSGRGVRAATPAQTNHWPLWAKLLRLMAVNRDAGGRVEIGSRARMADPANVVRIRTV